MIGISRLLCSCQLCFVWLDRQVTYRLIFWYLSVYHDTSADFVPLNLLATFRNSLAMLKLRMVYKTAWTATYDVK